MLYVVYVVGIWGFISLKKLNHPNECIRVNIGHKIVIIIHVCSLIIGAFRRIKIFIIILYKLVVAEFFQTNLWFYPPKVMQDRLNLRAPASGCRNGFIYYSSESSNDKVSILIISISCVDLSSGMSPELSAASRVDSNTSLSVWSNLYPMELVCVFLRLSIYWNFDDIGRWSLPQSSPIRNWMSCLVRFGEINAMSRMSVLPFALSRCMCLSLFK